MVRLLANTVLSGGLPYRLPHLRKTILSVNLLKALTIVTFAEAISWLGLLFGMVLKYGFDDERGVSTMGPIHGMLFVVFAVLLLATHIQLRWPVRKTALAFVESIPPFTGFLLGRQLLDDLRVTEAHRAAQPRT